MKKLLVVLGGIFAVLILATAIRLYILNEKVKALDSESKAYVDEVTPKILANMNKETLFQYSSDELKNSASPKEFDKAFNRLAKLGQFREYQGADGHANVLVTPEKGKQITGIYEAQAEFESGLAAIKIDVIKKGNNWQIIGFLIDSPVLANK